MVGKIHELVEGDNQKRLQIVGIGFYVLQFGFSKYGNGVGNPRKALRKCHPLRASVTAEKQRRKKVNEIGFGISRK